MALRLVTKKLKWLLAPPLLLLEVVVPVDDEPSGLVLHPSTGKAAMLRKRNTA